MFYQPNECAKTQRVTLQLFLLLLVDLYLMGLQITTTLSTPIFQKERTYHLNKDSLASIAAYVTLIQGGKIQRKESVTIQVLAIKKFLVLHDANSQQRHKLGLNGSIALKQILFNLAPL